MKDYLLVYGIIVTVGIISFLRHRKKSDQPSKLDLKRRAGRGYKPVHLPSLYKVGDRSKMFEDEESVPGIKNLNVVFNYNGYSWDAYEALGVPAGSDQRAVEQAYLQMSESLDAESRPFIDQAYHAIRIRNGWRKDELS